LALAAEAQFALNADSRDIGAAELDCATSLVVCGRPIVQGSDDNDR